MCKFNSSQEQEVQVVDVISHSPNRRSRQLVPIGGPPPVVVKLWLNMSPDSLRFITHMLMNSPPPVHWFSYQWFL